MTMDGQDTLEDPLGTPVGLTDEGLPEVDVVICAYTPAREAFLRRAIASIVDQDATARVIVVIDHSPELFATLGSDATLGTRVAIVQNAYEQGLSGARNTGVDCATAPVVAFLDDDACAEQGWLEAIRRAHADPSTVGTGGWVAPEWEGGARPAWLPQEFWWIVGCSYRGLPTAPMAVIRNPIGASMSFARIPLQDAGGFRSGFGRIGTTPLGCEETEAAIRVRAAVPGSRIVHLTDTRVGHYVPRARTTWRYFRDRCLAEGRSKAMVADAAGTRDGLSSERRYVLRVLPGGVLRGLGDAARGDVAGLQRAGAIVAGVTLTAAGYLVGRHELARADDGTSANGQAAWPGMRTPLTVAVVAAAGGLWARHRLRGRAKRGPGRR